MPIIDVRDCAEMHLRSIEVEKAGNKRFISNAESLWFMDIAKALCERYSKEYKIPMKEMPWAMAKLGSMIGNPDAKRVIQYWGKDINLSHEKAETILGMKFRIPTETIYDTVEAMIKTGHIKKQESK